MVNERIDGGVPSTCDKNRELVQAVADKLTELHSLMKGYRMRGTGNKTNLPRS